MHWFSRIVKWLLCFFCLITAATGIFWIYVYVQSVGVVRERLNDLAMIVAEENCISEIYQPSYNSLLTMSETPWLTFPNRTGPYADRPYKVMTPSGVYAISYETAPQRGSALYIQLTGNIELPYLFGWGSKGNDSETLSTGGQRSLYVTNTQKYVVMGLKFYKDKERTPGN